MWTSWCHRRSSSRRRIRQRHVAVRRHREADAEQAKDEQRLWKCFFRLSKRRLVATVCLGVMQTVSQLMNPFLLDEHGESPVMDGYFAFLERWIADHAPARDA